MYFKHTMEMHAVIFQAVWSYGQLLVRPCKSNAAHF